MDKFIGIIKIAVIIFLIALMAWPIIPLGDGSKRNDKPHAMRFGYPKNKRNAPFILLAFVEAIVLALVINLLSNLCDTLLGIPFIDKLVSTVAKNQSSTFEFDKIIILTILVNLVVIYIFFFLKTSLKIGLTKAWEKSDKRLKEKNEKKEQEEKDKEVVKTDEKTDENKNNSEDEKDKQDDEDNNINDSVKTTSKPKKKKRVAKFKLKVNRLSENISEKLINLNQKAENYQREYVKEPGLLKRLFFEGEHLEYGKPWVVLGESILSTFVKVLKVLYLFFFFILLISVFYPGPEWLYTFLIDFLKFNDWYLYPFISLIILQEICNTLYSKMKFEKYEEKEETEEEIEYNEMENNVELLQEELIKRYDEDHYLRVFPYINDDGDEEHEESK